MRKLRRNVCRLIRITCRAGFCTVSSGLSDSFIVKQFVSVYVGIPEIILHWELVILRQKQVSLEHTQFPRVGFFSEILIYFFRLSRKKHSVTSNCSSALSS